MTKRLVLFPTRMEMDAVLRHLPASLCEGGTTVYETCGVGPACAAMRSQQAIDRWCPERIWLIGVAGAFATSGLVPGDVVQGHSDRFADLGYMNDRRFVTLEAMNLDMWQTDLELDSVFELLADVPNVRAVPMITVSAMTASAELASQRSRDFNAATESMEGAAVAMVCHWAGLPFSQLRGISNTVGPRDRDAWRMVEALHAVAKVLASFAP